MIACHLWIASSRGVQYKTQIKCIFEHTNSISIGKYGAISFVSIYPPRIPSVLLLGIHNSPSTTLMRHVGFLNEWAQKSYLILRDTWFFISLISLTTQGGEGGNQKRHNNNKRKWKLIYELATSVCMRGYCVAILIKHPQD